MPQTEIVVSRQPSAAMTSRIVRSASGSPQPAQSECWPESSRLGFSKTLCSAAGSRSILRLSAWIHALHAREDLGAAQQRAHAEARSVVTDAADRMNRNASGDRELHVLDHLPGRQLEHRDPL